ncbi:aminomethyl-transferring glycine dehydrogenase subunit GcvPA [Thiotrichales bacterium 19S9-12]|nr:aminomethyl-transferring glycine dehydrogenase subunit GcvPA [Thiotrichales bacterium 19S9-11]MCF6812321.1 aminomethyl-transferring glycine dehydrogenase subunit GcvPA [Thiotrichales bacterium 19S9-12]
MPFIPQLNDDIKSMLDAIGADNVEALFDEIPNALRIDGFKEVPEGINEMEMSRLMYQRAEQDQTQLNFIGAGAYQHHIPAAIWDLVSRGEYMTAYTPYQAEASQGNLQLIYEFQTMIASLTKMDVANASMYDGASALAEAVLMSVRVNRKSKSKKILIADSIHPHYMQVLESITSYQDITFEVVNFNYDQGFTSLDALKAYEGNDYAAVIIPQPNFLGQLTQTDDITNWAHEQNALVIAVVNPTSLALIKAPGDWGNHGADIVVGEGQPLGIPLASGGPYVGFMSCKQAIVRQMPGRIVGRTTDSDGKDGFCLTLQAREQHIRRSKATSNICTNQGLLMTAATIYLSLLGVEGLKQVAKASHHNMLSLREKLSEMADIKTKFSHNFFHETVIELPVKASEVIEKLAEKNIQAGYDLGNLDPRLDHMLLICSTEVHNSEDHNHFLLSLEAVLSQINETQGVAVC